MNWIKRLSRADEYIICWLLSTQIHCISKWIIIGLTDNLQGTGWIGDGLIWGHVGSYLGAGWTGWTGLRTGWLAPHESKGFVFPHLYCYFYDFWLPQVPMKINCINMYKDNHEYCVVQLFCMVVSLSRHYNHDFRCHKSNNVFLSTIDKVKWVFDIGLIS